MTTDTTERGLEQLICMALTGSPCEPGEGSVSDPPAAYGCKGWICGFRRWMTDTVFGLTYESPGSDQELLDVRGCMARDDEYEDGYDDVADGMKCPKA